MPGEGSEIFRHSVPALELASWELMEQVRLDVHFESWSLHVCDGPRELCSLPAWSWVQPLVWVLTSSGLVHKVEATPNPAEWFCPKQDDCCRTEKRKLCRFKAKELQGWFEEAESQTRIEQGVIYKLGQIGISRESRNRLDRNNYGCLHSCTNKHRRRRMCGQGKRYFARQKEMKNSLVSQTSWNQHHQPFSFQRIQYSLNSLLNCKG